MSRLKELVEERAKLDKDSRALLDAAEADKRELSAEEATQWDEMDRRISAIGTEVDRRERQAVRETKLDESMGRLTTPDGPGDDARRAAIQDSAASADPAAPTVLKINGHDFSLKPGTPEHVRASVEYAERFGSYLHGHPGVEAGMQVGPDPKGGYLTTVQFNASLLEQLRDEVFMRRISRVLPPLTTAVGLGVPTLDTRPGDFVWGAEVPASDLTEDDAMALGKREFIPHLGTLYLKVSRKLLRSAVISAEALVRDQIAYKRGISEEKAFLTGDGAQQPLGVFTASSDGISTSRDTTSNTTTSWTADNLIDCLYALKGGYQQRATWLVHRTFIRDTRKLKDGNGQYLWRAGLEGQPSTILDRPYIMSEDAPSTFTTGLYAAIVGDFQFYWIVDALGMEIQRLGELLALKNQVGFLARMETDGMPVLEEAFQRLIIK